MKKMKRYYFIDDDLDDLDDLEDELEKAGFDDLQIHVLSLDDAAVDHHDHLHSVVSLLRRDVIHSGEYGFVGGILAALLTLGVTWLFGWHETAAGWVPFIFLAVVLFGFFTWEGGFIGFQEPNINYRRFKRELENGRHVFFVDVLADSPEEAALHEACRRHPGLKEAGIGAATPHWVLRAHRQWRHVINQLP